MSNNEEHTGEAPQFHREGDAFVFDKPPSAEEAARKRRQSEQHEFARDQVKTNRALAWFTGALVVATFCTIGVAIWQGTISQKAANAARDAVIVATNTLTETQASNERQRLANLAAAREAKVIADQNAAQTARALQATIDNFQQDQRPYVGEIPDRAEPPGVSLIPDKPNLVQIVWNWHIENFGKTPATQIEMHQEVSTDGTTFIPSYASNGKREGKSDTRGGTEPPGGKAFNTAFFQPMPSEEAQKVLASEKGIFIRVTIIYHGLHGQRFETRLCHQYAQGNIGNCTSGYMR